MDLRLLPTEELTGAQLDEIRAVCDSAFAERDRPRLSRELSFTAEDWHHALGGLHAIAVHEGTIAAHAAVVERELRVADVPLRTGYVEAVATRPDLQRRGSATEVMHAASDHIRSAFAIGALDTSRHRFYERVGWERWRGPTSVRAAEGLVRTAEEDSFVMVLRTPSGPPLDPEAPISCEWRPGDVW